MGYWSDSFGQYLVVNFKDELTNGRGIGVQALHKGIFGALNVSLYAVAIPIFISLHFPPFACYSDDPFFYLLFIEMHPQ